MRVKKPTQIAPRLNQTTEEGRGTTNNNNEENEFLSESLGIV